jgi:cytochrome c oxidase subunit 1
MFYILANIKTCNHKILSLYYLGFAIISLIAGVIFSLIIKIELYESGNRIISSDNLNFYNLDITLHGLIMIFFVLMPGLFGGLGNYLIPIYVGSPEIVQSYLHHYH